MPATRLSETSLTRAANGKSGKRERDREFFCIKFVGSLDGSLCDVNSAYLRDLRLAFAATLAKLFVRRFGKFARQIYESGEFSLKNCVKFQFVCRDFLSSVCVVLLRAG